MRIGAVADRLGVSRDTIRRLEREGAVVPLRDRVGQRRYTEADIARLRETLFPKRAAGSIAE